MKKLVSLILGLTLTSAIFAAQPLVSPQELQLKLKDPLVRVIDLRDAKTFATSHIAGSLNAPYGAWRGPAANAGELPTLPKLTVLVQSLGLTASTPVMLVSSGANATDFGVSARVYWTLKVLGITELSILNGGIKGWTLAGMPQDNLLTKVVASSYQPSIDSSLLATKEQLVQRINTGELLLMDARPAAFFNGETRVPAAKSAGTLPGAVNLEFDRWFIPGTSTFVTADQARKIAASSPIDPAKETVSFCNTGHWAAINWFAMSEVLGQKNVKLYAGSMVDWSQDPNGLPMAHVPGRAKQLLMDGKIWFAQTFN
jgi:thiosulfate/3-mercaptopyruvate sulfurtransferase